MQVFQRLLQKTEGQGNGFGQSDKGYREEVVVPIYFPRQSSSHWGGGPLWQKDLSPGEMDHGGYHLSTGILAGGKV